MPATAASLAGCATLTPDTDAAGRPIVSEREQAIIDAADAALSTTWKARYLGEHGMHGPGRPMVFRVYGAATRAEAVALVERKAAHLGGRVAVMLDLYRVAA